VLHVHDDVEVVEQNPPPVAFTFPAHRFRAELQQPLLDRVDHSTHLPVVWRRRQHEAVGDDELLAHVEDEQIGCELVRRGRHGCLGKLDAPA
jgi:hypothetical protein